MNAALFWQENNQWEITNTSKMATQIFQTFCQKYLNTIRKNDMTKSIVEYRIVMMMVLGFIHMTNRFPKDLHKCIISHVVRVVRHTIVTCPDVLIRMFGIQGIVTESENEVITVNRC